MLNDTRTQLVFIRVVVLILHFIGPACTTYTAALARRALASRQWPSATVLNVWCIAETAFYFFFLWYRRHLQKEAIHPPLRTKEERKLLFEKVRSEIHDPERFLSGWFRGAKIEDIGREDLKEFLSWAFWEGRSGDADEQELEELVSKVEKMMRRTFPPGRGTAKSLRLTLDPIDMECRSLLWYTIIMLVDTISHVRLLAYGIKYHSSFKSNFAVFPPRPLAAATSSAKSPAQDLAYWVRPHTSKTRRPIVYLHGIGVGLHPNVEFLHELDLALNSSTDPKDRVGILSLEILQISSRLTHSILTRAEFLEQFAAILDAHGWDKIVLLSHSYGSVLSTHILTDPALSARVSSVLLVDPVTILLHMPDVAYNFTVREPKMANEWQLWYFASKDPGVAHTLGRHFHWSQNLLWRSRIMELVDRGMKVTASLARRDLIVDTESVGAYLMEGTLSDPVLVKNDQGEEKMELRMEKDDEHWKKRQWSGKKGLEVLWWDDLDHAQIFDTKERREKLVKVLVEYSKAR